MSGPIGTSQLMYSAAPGDFYTHQIPNSLRIPATSSTESSNGRLTKTFGTVDSKVHFTLNFWIKKAVNGGLNPVTSARPLTFFTPRSGTSGSVLHEFKFCAAGAGGTAGDALMITTTNSNTIVLSTTNLFRDTSAWYNIHIQADLDNSTNSEKLKIFVNGTEAIYSTDNRGSYTELPGFVAGAWTIGDYYNYGYPAQCYFAQWAYVDGTTYAASVFGETKNGAWIPKDLSSGITWGSAGHLLMFQDSSALGDDTSGEGNDYATANIAAHDQMLDSPTFGSDNGGNFATLGPLWKNPSGTTLSEGNLVLTASTSGIGAMSNWAVPASGKWYWEVCYTNQYSTSTNFLVGIAYAKTSLTAVETADQIVYYSENGMKIVESTRTAGYGDGFDSPDGDAVVGVAVDRVNNTLNFSYNGTFQGTIDISGLTSNEFFPYTGFSGVDDIQGCTFNFGQDGTFAGAISAGGNADDTGYGNFKYDPPSGFLAMCSGNLPTPSTDPADDNEPTKHHGCLLYTGTGQTSQAQTGLGFLPDMVLIKSRNYDAGWRLFDSSRGVTQGLYIHNTDAEQDINDSLTAFGSDGFTVGENAGTGQDTKTYVAWCWKANGGTTVTNSDGTLNCTQQVNANAGFSISTYTGNGQNSTIGHGLATIPDITMFRERGTAGNWIFRIKGDGNDNNLYPQIANATSDGDYFQDTAATASVTSIGTHGDINGSTQTYVMWAWENKEGFSKHGLFEGNGNVDGTFQYLGFSPAFVMLKSLDSTSGWYVYDNKRLGYNVDNNSLEWDVATVEQTDDQIDLLSNGFKLRIAADPNVAETFVYMAFAAVPFKYATAR